LLALTYRTTSSPLRDRVVEMAQADLDAVGFDIRVELQPREVFFGDVTGLIVGDFEIGQFAELTDADPGGEQQYGCEWIPTPDNGWYGENYAGWCNTTANQALIDASRSLLVEDRREAYTTFQREFTRDLPGLPLFPRVVPFLVNSELENFKPNDFMPSITWNAFELSLPND
jgi:ABC-type transport system substrate-binding protein